MATKIEWCDESWNPITGCTPVGAGCDNCYAERMAKRGLWDYGFDVTFHPDRLDQPLRWRQKKCDLCEEGYWWCPLCDDWIHSQNVGYDEIHAIDSCGGHVMAFNPDCARCHGTGRRPLRIFVDSMGDLFHESVKDEWIDKVFATMAIARKHDFIVLTKRPERMSEYLSFTTGKGNVLSRVILEACAMDKPGGPYLHDFGWPYRNIHLGISVWDQESADEFIPILLDTPAAVRVVSIEPMLGPVDVGEYIPGDRWFTKKPIGRFLDSVILGGETGPGARPMHPDWARSVRDQCQAAGVPFFCKGVGTAWVKKSEPVYMMLDGRTWEELP